jgi:hypothetical protein
LRQGRARCWPKPWRRRSLIFSLKHAGLKTEDGPPRLVRHGHLPERDV